MDGSRARQVWGRYREGEIRPGAQRGGRTAAGDGSGSTRPLSQLYGGNSLVSVLERGWNVMLMVLQRVRARLFPGEPQQ